MSYVEFIDFDLRETTVEDIRQGLTKSGNQDFLIREDQFDRYKDGKVVRRVYLAEGQQGESLPGQLTG